MGRLRGVLIALVLFSILGGVGFLVVKRLLERGDQTAAQGAGGGGGKGGEAASIPVEAAPVEIGPIENRRTFSGALEAQARVTIAPKVAGRIVAMPLDIADPVSRGQIIAELDGAEYQQAVMQAQAELAVAKAGLLEAENASDIAVREFDRVETLHTRGIASDSQLDTVRANKLAADAAMEVAKAQVTRAEASLEVERIRFGYTTIRAEWEGGDDQRIVAERYVEEGDTVSANTPLLSIIELDPIEAVIYVTEREYALLSQGQIVMLTTDAYPGREWEGQVERISPIFREGSRQARVQVRIDNTDAALKPGMFVRAQAVLGREETATIVPVEALAERGGRRVIFLIDRAGATARMIPVTTGIRSGARVQVIGEGIEGRVVTLGQQLLGDVTPIIIPADEKTADAQRDPASREGGGG